MPALPHSSLQVSIWDLERVSECVRVFGFGVRLRSSVVFLQLFGMFEERLGVGRLKGVAT